MSPRTLLDHFDLLAEAPGGVARLRELVLHLAVRGKLVPQDPADEPASELLKRIAKERARLVKEGKIRVGKPLPPVGTDEAPFEVPVGWEWGRLDETFDIGGGITKGRTLTGRTVQELPYLRVANVKAGYLDLTEVKTIQVPLDEVDRYQLRSGDVLFTEGGDWDKLGRSTVWQGEIDLCVHQNHIFRARPITDGVGAEWVSRYSNSSLGRDYFRNCSKQTTNLASINKTQLSNWPIPLPPLAEQQRIVARVGELMALLDRLEAARGARDTARLAARDSALAALRDAADASEVAAAWRRLEARLDDLFQAPEDVPPLREAILQLAVRGRLVPQDPADEPASELLKRIAKERARLVKEGKIRAGKTLPPVGAEEVPFEVPEGWVWVRLDELPAVPLTDGDWIETKDQDINGDVRLIQLADVGVGEFRDRSSRFLTSATTKRLHCTLLEPGDVLIARLPSPIGRACIFPGLGQPAVTAVDVAIARLTKSVDRRYLVSALNSGVAREQVESYGKGATRFRVSTGHLRTILLPLPPLPEQHRIVARVDALMVLCDRLESRLAAAREAQTALSAAAVHHIAQPDFAA